jgi:hypothetical protein
LSRSVSGPGSLAGLYQGDGMETVANYIIRIYRYDKDRPQSLVGVVVEPGEKVKKAFQSYDELWEILNSPKEAKHLWKGEEVIR